MDLYDDNWSLLSENRIDVVFIDAAHNYASVLSDAMHSLQLSDLRWLVFHDYSIENEEASRRYGMQVKLAVQDLVEAGLLDCGGAPPPRAAHGHPGTLGRIEINGVQKPEAVICRVLKSWDWQAGHATIAWHTGSR